MRHTAAREGGIFECLSIATSAGSLVDNHLFAQILQYRQNPKQFIAEALDGQLHFLPALFNIQGERLSNLTRLLIRFLNQGEGGGEGTAESNTALEDQSGSVQSARSVSLAYFDKRISISENCIYAPALFPFIRDRLKAQLADPSKAENAAERKPYIFLPSDIYELFVRSPDWRPPIAQERVPKAPSYQPFEPLKSSSSAISIPRCVPSCLQYQKAAVSLSEDITISDLADILAPIAKAYLIGNPTGISRTGTFNPLGYLCFFEQIFGSNNFDSNVDNSDVDTDDTFRGVKEEDILPLACLAWCLSKSASSGRGELSEMLDVDEPTLRFEPRAFTAPIRQINCSGSSERSEVFGYFLDQLAQNGDLFDRRFPQDTVRGQFDRLSGCRQFQSDRLFVELVRSLCPLALPTKQDKKAQLLKPFCYLEVRRPAGTNQSSEDRYLQGHVTWTRAGEDGQVALYTVRIHTLHRHDSVIKHPTMRIYRMLCNPDSKSNIGSWQFLINKKFNNFKLIEGIKQYMVEDSTGNQWVSGTYVDSCSSAPFMIDGEKITPRQALLTATHFSFVDKSWLNS
jgi:hypothetical protein